MNTLDQRCASIIDQLIDALPEYYAWTPDDLVEQMKDLHPRQKQVVLAYWDCRMAGSSPKLAEMLALGTPPMSNTDREFLEGHCNGGQFGGSAMQEHLGDKYAAIAKERGVNVKGKIYLNGLAAFPGDPKAWVSDRGDVKRVCEERNYKCQGSVESKPDGRVDDL